MKKLLYLTMTILNLSFSMSNFSYAQDCIPTVFTYQEANYHGNFTLISTSDGGYLFTGSVTTDAGDKDLHIVRVDALGNLMWSKNFGGVEDDFGKNSKQTADGGFVIVGHTKSFSIHADQEAWLIKIDENGNEEWSQRYDAIEANNIELLPNGKYVIIGSYPINIFPVAITPTLWIARVNNMGFIEIEEIKMAEIPDSSLFQGFSNTYGTSVEVLEDGSYLLTGMAETATQVYPKPGHFYTVKTNAQFETEWEDVTEGNVFSKAASNEAVKHSDGYYYVAGGTSQSTCCDGIPYATIFKFDVNGNKIWRRTFSNVASRASSIRELETGELMVSGATSVFKIDTSGLVLWNSSQVGSLAITSPVLDSSDDGFIVLSKSYSNGPLLQLGFLDSLGNNCENRITGRVYRDNDGDCEFDAAEDDFLPNPFVFETPIDFYYTGIQSPFTVGNTQGEYILRVDTGTIEVAGKISAQYTNRDMWDLGCPDSTYTYTFDDVYQEEDSTDFAFTPNTLCPLLRVSSNLNQVRPFIESNLYVTTTNIGTEDALNVAVDVEIPELIIPDAAEIDLTYTQVGNIYTFTFDTIHWAEQKRIEIPYTTAEEAMIGDTVCLRTQIFQDTICAEFIGQGSSIRCRPVTNSYDPNVKILDLDSGKNCLDAPDEKLFYTIHFQNTGNDTAYQVVVIDSLSSLLDLNSFELLSSSHDVQYTFGAEGTLIFTFSDINLLDSLTNERESQGFVEFSIFPTEDFTLEQIIANRAHIYFDYNEPIVTDYAYVYACTENFTAQIINVEYDFSCENNSGDLHISAFHPQPLLYSIDNGENWQSNPVFPNLSPAEYVVCVKSIDGTIVHATDYIQDFNSYSTPEITNVNVENDTDCESFNGSIFIETNTEGGVEFSITAGLTWYDDPHFTGLRGGTYYIVVKNSQGCESAVQEIVLEGNSYFQLEEIDVGPACTDCNGKVRAYVSLSNDLTYSLNGASQSSSIFEDLCVGEYELIITQNSSGCEIIRTVVIDSIANFSFTNFGTNTTACEYGNNKGSLRPYTDNYGPMYFSLDGINYEYEHSGGSHYFPNLSAGDYLIYAQDNQGCNIVSDTFTINALTTPIIESVESIIDCTDSLGTLVVNASGGETFSYSFNGGQSFAYQENSQDSLAVGEYQIVIRNESYCLSESETAYLVSSGDAEILTVDVDLPECSSNWGQIEVIVNELTDLEYSIDDGMTWQSSAQFVDITAGTYDILIKNIYSDCVIAYELNPIIVEVNAPDWTFPVLYESDLCADEQAYIFINSDLAEGYEYSIDNGENWETDILFGNLSAGAYNVKVRNLNTGCEQDYPENPVLININETIQFSAEIETTYCDNEIGSIEISLTDSENKEYSIDNGQNWTNTTLFENLPAGLFNLLVRDIENQCISEYANNPVNIEEINAPEIIEINTTNPTNLNNADGEIVVNITGEETVEYSIDNGTNWQISNTFSNLPVGNYQPVIRYMNGLCTVEGELVNLSFTSSNRNKETVLETFSINPNPFADNFTININEENLSHFSFKITDAIGRSILQKEVQSSQYLVDTKDWLSGVYFIYLENEYGYSIQKIVKQ